MYEVTQDLQSPVSVFPIDPGFSFQYERVMEYMIATFRQKVNQYTTEWATVLQLAKRTRGEWHESLMVIVTYCPAIKLTLIFKHCNICILCQLSLRMRQKITYCRNTLRFGCWVLVHVMLWSAYMA